MGAVSRVAYIYIYKRFFTKVKRKTKKAPEKNKLAFDTLQTGVPTHKNDTSAPHLNPPF